MSKTTIRANSFETNSSSAHALCMFSPEQWRDFTEGGMYLSFDDISDIDLWKYEPENGDINEMNPFGVSYFNHPLYDTYVLVPPDKVDEALAEKDEWSASEFYEPSYEGEENYWWSHQNAGLMTYEDMKKNTWHDQEWPQIEVMDDGWVKMYYSREH